MGMEKVLGFGGLFFRADKPAELAQWYLDHLGIDLVPATATGRPWVASGGPTVFAPFERDTAYFAADKDFMINFRVARLEAMLAQLAQAGIPFTVQEDMPGIGKFAHLHDPEGNPIELWEPASG
jgi:catechol 2,3-dioxygenase-like lactoylglutathione lyase family enzyme